MGQRATVLRRVLALCGHHRAIYRRRYSGPHDRAVAGIQMGSRVAWTSTWQNQVAISAPNDAATGRDFAFVTYVTAGLMHNVTSILIMTPVIIRLCASYQVPSRWILSAALIASNLGGFSTRWGDTPNIIESATWGLKAGDFMCEVLPANLIVLAC